MFVCQYSELLEEAAATDPVIVTDVPDFEAESVNGAVPEADTVPIPPNPDKVGAAGKDPEVIPVTCPAASLVIPVTT